MRKKFSQNLLHFVCYLWTVREKKIRTTTLFVCSMSTIKQPGKQNRNGKATNNWIQQEKKRVIKIILNKISG